MDDPADEQLRRDLDDAAGLILDFAWDLYDSRPGWYRALYDGGSRTARLRQLFRRPAPLDDGVAG